MHLVAFGLADACRRREHIHNGTRWLLSMASKGGVMSDGLNNTTLLALLHDIETRIDSVLARLDAEAHAACVCPPHMPARLARPAASADRSR